MSGAGLPEGWVLSTFGETCDLNPKLKLNDELDIGFMPMSGVPTDYFGKCIFETRKWKEVKKGFTQFQDGDAIFAKITPCFENGKATVIENFPNQSGAGSTEYFVLRPVNTLIDPRWLYARVKTKDFLINGALNMSGSVGHKRVPKDFVENYPLPVPPNNEQKVIAQRLDTLLAQVDNTKTRLEQIPKILKRFRQAVLAAAVCGKLTEEWQKLNSKNLEHEFTISKLKQNDNLFKQAKSTLPNIPQYWQIMPSAHLIEYVTSGSRGWANYYSTEGALFLRMSNVRYDTTKLDLNDLQFVSLPAEVEGKRSLVKINDLIISITADVGRVARIDKDLGEAYINQHLALARPVKDIHPEFFAMCIASQNIGVKQIQSLKKGATKAGLGLDDIRSLAIPVPPLAEQHEIVRRVDQLFACADTIEKQVNAALDRVNHLTQSILAKAFRGELTAQWRAENPDLISGENSAAALLEKIKAERAAAPKKASRKKT